MALRFLADHCISNFTIQVLRDSGHEVVRLRDVLRVESPDTLVIAKAQELGAILVSLNGDFADIVTYPPRNYKGIIAFGGAQPFGDLPQLLARLTAYLNLQPTMLHYNGKLFVVEVDRIRIRE